MKFPYSILIFLSSCLGFGTEKKIPEQKTTSPEQSQALYQIEVTTLTGDKILLSKFKGKKIVFVNTASKCGFTQQYEELQELYEKHGDKVVLIGVPSNDFGNQEPGTEEEIKDFCKLNYGVSFLMLEKAQVKGSEKHPLYQWLTNSEKNGWNDQEPKWNFNKYIVDEKGTLTHYFGSSVTPLSGKFLRALNLK